jgi:general stress protein YciG
MADREQSHTAKPGMSEKPQHQSTGTAGHTGGQADLTKQRDQVKPGGTVGREVPDQSFQHNTEIAVEAGRKGEHRDDKK